MKHEMPPHGTFCWNELATTDPAAAKTFYGELFGWQFKESDAGGMTYAEIVAGGEHVGGLYRPGPEQGGAPPHWMAYVSVDDVDARAARAAELGGKVCVGPMDIPNVGRFCVITDPTGAAISLITLSGQHA
jgi:predicted enzyme related to lactoylglutathione lyase